MPGRAPRTPLGNVPRFRREGLSLPALPRLASSFASIGAGGGPGAIAASALTTVGRALLKDSQKDKQLAAKAYLARTELALDQTLGGLAAEHPSDVAAFTGRATEERDAWLKNFQGPDREAASLAFDIKAGRIAGSVRKAERKRIEAESNADILRLQVRAGDQALAAWRAGDAAAAVENDKVFRRQLGQRTDILPQTKAAALLNSEKAGRRQTVLGEFDRAAARSLDGAGKLIDTIRTGNAIANPVERDGLVAELDRSLTALRLKAKARDKRNARIARVAGAISGKAFLDPRDTEDRKAVDEAWAAWATQPQMQKAPPAVRSSYAADFVRRTGLIPKSLEGEIRGALRSGDAGRIAQAGDMLGRIEQAAPRALADFSKADIALGLNVQSLVSAGVDPEAAAKRALETSNPDNKATIDARMETLKRDKVAADYLGWLKNEFDPTGLLDFVPFGPSNDAVLPERLQARATGDFATLFEDWYRRTGNEDVAKKQALREFRRVWGVTAADGNLRAMKYPPEAFYGIGAEYGFLGGGGDGEWMRAQLEEDLANRDGENVTLISDALTARQASAGRPTWAVMKMNSDGVFEPLTDKAGRLMRWAPDAKRAKSKRAKKALDKALKKRADRLDGLAEDHEVDN